MQKPKKEITEDDVLAAILKVKPSKDMPRPKASKRKATKAEEKSPK